jgi:hypothetical protein
MDQAELILKFTTAQDRMGLFGDPWSHMTLELIANPKPWLGI